MGRQAQKTRLTTLLFFPRPEQKPESICKGSSSGCHPPRDQMKPGECAEHPSGENAEVGAEHGQTRCLCSSGSFFLPP